jgi:nucleoside-diphosphate-sugar epimerase
VNVSSLGINVLVTGATGFIGRSLVQKLTENSRYLPVAAVRDKPLKSPLGVKLVLGCDLLSNNNWNEALSDIEVVLHTAARAHVLAETVTDPLTEFRKVNTMGTLNLARQAADSGVRRFIFISSIGVNGNQSVRPFSESDALNPVEPYAISKQEAEFGLRQLAEQTDMEIVIIRPPLVYGAEAPGNFNRLINVISKGIPLPLGAVRNQRSLIALDNLVDLIVTCIDHPAAGNQTFLVSDGHDLSTTELVRLLGDALGTPARLLPVPVGWIEMGTKLLGRPNIYRQLCGSLQIDISKVINLLGWRPPISVEEGLKIATKEF